MWFPARYRRSNPYNHWNYNPDNWEADVRGLLQKITGDGWRVGQGPPSSWFTPYLSNHPDWSPVWIVANALHTTSDELLVKIRPGRRRTRDVDELNILYEYIKEYLAGKGSIRGKDVATLAGSLGLESLSGTEMRAAQERSALFKQLVQDGYAEQVMGRFKGSSHYLPTSKLLEERNKKLGVSAPVAILPPLPLPLSILPTSIATTSLPPIAVVPTSTISPTTIKSGKLARQKPLTTYKILLIGGQGATCPGGSSSLRPITDAECKWLDSSFRWRVLASYKDAQFRKENLPAEVDLVIIFSKYMGHSQADIATAFCQKNNIPFISNHLGQKLGSLKMAANHAKIHGPKWFSDSYEAFQVSRKKPKPRRRHNPWMHFSL